MRKSGLLSALLGCFIAFSSCSIQNMDQQEGVIWDVYTAAPVTCGIEIKDNNIYFADAFANIYSLWIDTGSTRWKRTLVSETVTGIYPDNNNLVVVSVNSSMTIIRYYSYNEGNIVFQTNLDLVVRDSYLSDSGRLILHTSAKLVVFDLTGGKTDVYDYSLYLNMNEIKTLIKGNGFYYIITGKSRILKVNDKFEFLGVSADFEGEPFYGSALYLNYNLYLSSPTGIKVLPPIGQPYRSSMNGQISYSTMTAVSDPFSTVIYTGLSGTSRFGLGRYSQNMSDISEDWYRQTFSSVTWSPVVYSDTLSVVAALDDSGMLNVFDAASGKFVYSKYLGIITRPDLKFKNDYYSKSIFIPVSSPAKIVCYSLYYAVNHRRF